MVCELFLDYLLFIRSIGKLHPSRITLTVSSDDPSSSAEHPTSCTLLVLVQGLAMWPPEGLVRFSISRTASKPEQGSVRRRISPIMPPSQAARTDTMDAGCWLMAMALSGEETPREKGHS